MNHDLMQIDVVVLSTFIFSNKKWFTASEGKFVSVKKYTTGATTADMDLQTVISLVWF